MRDVRKHGEVENWLSTEERRSRCEFSLHIACPCGSSIGLSRKGQLHEYNKGVDAPLASRVTKQASDARAHSGRCSVPMAQLGLDGDHEPRFGVRGNELGMRSRRVTFILVFNLESRPNAGCRYRQLVAGASEVVISPKPADQVLLELAMVTKDVEVIGKQEIGRHHAAGDDRIEPLGIRRFRLLDLTEVVVPLDDCVPDGRGPREFLLPPPAAEHVTAVAEKEVRKGMPSFVEEDSVSDRDDFVALVSCADDRADLAIVPKVLSFVGGMCSKLPRDLRGNALECHRASIIPGTPSNRNPLDFVKRDLVGRAVVQFRRSGRLVRRDLLGVLEGASILEVGGDAGCAERMAADRRQNSGGASSPANHLPRLGLR